MLTRSRRLRNDINIRSMIRETRVSPSSLILPVFLKEGTNIKNSISTLEGHYQYSPDRISEFIDNALEHDIKKVLLFGIPDEKDELGSQSFAEHGIVQEGIRAIKEKYKNEIYIITDVCMCEYTSHGHCGILDGTTVNNDVTLDYLAKIAVSHAEAGADMVAPSDMMDGRVLSIRNGLDAKGFSNTPIMSYSIKYASSFYGPFRDAAGSAPSFGDRKSYQMDFHNIKEGMKEAQQDTLEGADILMVKPALSYLDVIKELSRNTNLPIAAYSVSGEYAMIKAASKMGLVDEYGIMCESAISTFRAGADILITYYAKELADAMRKGDIG